jgi:alkylation response protein AidB-like acyl-CoA dehydrogenase
MLIRPVSACMRRLWCAIGSAGLMRRCVAEATFHTAHRKAFGSVLNQTDLMRNVLADLVCIIFVVCCSMLVCVLFVTFCQRNR